MGWGPVGRLLPPTPKNGRKYQIKYISKKKKGGALQLSPLVVIFLAVEQPFQRQEQEQQQEEDDGQDARRLKASNFQLTCGDVEEEDATRRKCAPRHDPRDTSLRHIFFRFLRILFYDFLDTTALTTTTQEALSISKKNVCLYEQKVETFSSG